MSIRVSEVNENEEKSSLPEFSNERFRCTLRMVKKIFKSGQIGYYVFNLKKLSYYNYNVLLYTNSPNAMTVNIFDYEPVYSYQYKNVYRNVRLFFIDPMKPEYESFNQDKLQIVYISSCQLRSPAGNGGYTRRFFLCF